MPTHDHLLSVVLGPGDWTPGIACRIDFEGTNWDSERGLPVVSKVTWADTDTRYHILGWTICSGKEGDVVALRTNLDGTVNVQAYIDVDPIEPGDALYITDSGDGRSTRELPPLVDCDKFGWAITGASETGEYVEAFVMSQKQQYASATP